MLFKDLTKGSLIYILENNSSLSIKECNVISISQPHFDIRNNNGQLSSSAYSNQVIDILLNVNNRNVSYTVNENADNVVQAPNNNTLLIDKENLVKQLRNLKCSLENIIKDSELAKTKLSDVDLFLDEYDIDFKNKKATEARLDSIEDKFNDLDVKLNAILNSIKEK